jgi:molybdopterin converting factor small subunit
MEVELEMENELREVEVLDAGRDNAGRDNVVVMATIVEELDRMDEELRDAAAVVAAIIEEFETIEDALRDNAAVVAANSDISKI